VQSESHSKWNSGIHRVLGKHVGRASASYPPFNVFAIDHGCWDTQRGQPAKIGQTLGINKRLLGGIADIPTCYSYALCTCSTLSIICRYAGQVLNAYPAAWRASATTIPA
jgi:hypothetical protein